MERILKVVSSLFLIAFVGSLTNSCSKKDENSSITSIQADNKQYEVEVGSIVDLSVITTPVNIADKSLLWTSSDSKIATVTKKTEKTAVIKGVSEGYINVIVYYNSFVKASFGVTVKRLPISVSISPNEATIEAKKTITLKVSPTVENPDEVFEWKSLNEGIATVSSSGVVTGKQPGVVTILATGTTSGAVGPAKITVTPPYVPVSRIDLSQNSTRVPLNGDLMLTAVVLPADATNKNVTWSSSDPKVAQIDPITGNLSGLKVGTVTITATSTVDATKKGTVSIEVVIIPVMGLTLDRTSATLSLGGKTTLVATVLPANASDKTVTWGSSNTAIATVSATGEVTSQAVGTADIRATSNSDSTKFASSRITVTPVAVSSVTLNMDTATIVSGNKVTLIATVSPSEVVNKKVRWASLNGSVATVSTTGEVTGLSEGTTIITATSEADNTKFATATVTVSPIPVSSITLDKTTASIQLGSSATFTATVSPSSVANKTVSWTSSDPNVATVSSTGVVTPVSVGNTIITATSNADNAKYATATVTVTPVPVLSITLDKTTATININASTTIVATVLPANATNKNVTWSSSNNAVATVTGGVVTGLSGGTTVIRATSVSDTSKFAEATVTVNVPVSSVSLNPSSASINVDGNTTLVATVSPGNATNKNVTWGSSNNSVATVTNGVVTAVASGTATITVTTADGNKTDTATITVTTPVVSVILNSSSLSSVDVSETITLVATVSPSNASNKNLIWSSSDATIATVSSTGVVTGVGEGTVTITVTSEADSTKRDSKTITVNNNPPAADVMRKFTYNNHTYFVIAVSGYWSNCRTYATNYGGYLVEIDSAGEQAAIQAELSKLINAGSFFNVPIAPGGGGAQYLWIGATDINTEGTWLWSKSGTTIGRGQGFAGSVSPGSWVSSTYQNFGTIGAQQFEPDNYMDNQDYAGIALQAWPYGAQFQWNDLGAHTTYFIMEKQ